MHLPVVLPMTNKHQTLSDKFTIEMEQKGYTPVYRKGWTNNLRDGKGKLFSHWRKPDGSLVEDAEIYRPWLRKKIAEGGGEFE